MMQSLEYDACPVAVAREIDDSIAFRSGGFFQNGRHTRKWTLSKWVIVLASLSACVIGASLLLKFRPLQPSLRGPPPAPDLVQDPPIQPHESPSLDLPDGGPPPPPLDELPPPLPNDGPPPPGHDTTLAESEPNLPPPNDGPGTPEIPQQNPPADNSNEHHHHHGENYMDNPDNQHHHHDDSNHIAGHPPPVVHPETPLPAHEGDDTLILPPPDRPLPFNEDGSFTVVHPAHNVDNNHGPGGSGGHGHPHVDGPTSVTQLHPDDRDRRDERPPRDEVHPHDDRVPPEEVFGTYSGPPKRDPPKEEPQTPPDQLTEEDGGD